MLKTKRSGHDPVDPRLAPAEIALEHIPEKR